MAINSQRLLGSFGIIGAVLAAFCLPPRNYAIVSGILTILSFVLVNYMRSRWVESEPNEWLLIIKNGKLVRAGIGLKTVLWPLESVVKFSSVVQKVTFKAKNVTKEMSGIEIQGFAFWSVFREGDGPFKCYKYMQGGDANSSVQTMCESIVRNEMANCSLEEVLRDRSKLRDRMKIELEKQLTGWGIWLETVELTDVQICSVRLFEDLQADFRQETHLKAEQIRLNTKERMRQTTLVSETKLSTARQDAETQKLKIRNEEELKRQQQESIFYEKSCEFAKRRMESEKALTLDRMTAEQVQEEARISNKRVLDKRRNDFDAENFKKDLEVDKSHNETSLAKWAIDSSERIYNKMGVRDIKVHQFLGDDKKTVAAMVPGIQFMVAQGDTAR